MVRRPLQGTPSARFASCTPSADSSGSRTTLRIPSKVLPIPSPTRWLHPLLNSRLSSLMIPRPLQPSICLISESLLKTSKNIVGEYLTRVNYQNV
ncbi:hypothetical protein PCANC_16195 [Puccinia coronata f. sp. avenae]|uniref:Uncharacterized protein n=1 Tax=Puccinia coronata f. sp. avenae TaxID=200324 RepID=A0A2N5UF36_9BASI|nr:hypothetical protein PCANC_16195 [Puccinia coronata f. sp. avenae]